VHGQHDLSELESLHPSLVLVEALRYGHLAAESGQKRPPRFDDIRWLIVGGAECDRSNRELQEVLTAMRLQSVTPHVVIKWHPQCGAPTVELPDNASVSGEPLASLIDKTSVALMVGSAAPLDTYLRGIPSCSLRTPSGFSMTPVEESENFHTARDASDAVSWLLAAQSKPSFTPPVERYFSLDAALPRWRSLLASVLAD
jgi:surface carbohydrate biosynthesis protein (TIGR04326 family)